MSSDPVPPLPSETLEEVTNRLNCGLDESPCLILTLPSTSTIIQFCPTSRSSESDPDSIASPPFPVEVFEHIIDQSNDFDGSLGRLSLTCRAFLPRARHNLFFRIHIGHKEKLESAPAFLESRPWLPPLVRCLTLRDYVKRYPFKLLAVVPSRLMGMLPCLHSVEFASEWGGLGEQFPDMSRLLLAYSPSMLSILCKSYAHVRNLELSNGLWFQTLADFFRLVCALPQLKNLVINRISRTSDGNVSLVKNKTLGLMHLVIDILVDLKVIELLLDMGKATLQNLTMGIWEDQGQLESEDSITASEHSPMSASIVLPTIIAQIQCLQSLTLTLPWPHVLQLASKILNNIPTNEALQHLNIVYDLTFLTSLAFNHQCNSILSQHAFQVMREAISRLSLCKVTFFAMHYQRNRQGLWKSTLQ